MKANFSLLPILATCSLSAYAVEIWAPDNLGHTFGGTVSDRLIKFDSADPSNVTVVGDMGIAGTLFTGMDFSPNGTLYAYGRDVTVGGLFTVDQNTGQATLVGRGGIAAGYFVGDMSWDPVAQQMLVVATNAAAHAALYSVDLNTGLASLIGNITSPSQTQFVDVGLAVDARGNRYVQDVLSDQIFKLDGLTANALPTPLPYNSNFSQGLTIDWSRDDQGYHGAWDQDNNRAELYTFDKTSGAEAFQGFIGPVHADGTISEYEPGDLAIPPIPEPATLVFVAFGLLATLRHRSR